MTDTPIKATRWKLFTALGAKKYLSEFEGVRRIVIVCSEQPKLPLFWPVDPLLVEEVAGT